MKLFVLSYVYYEEYEPHYFLGPDNVTQKEFTNLCYSLLDDASLLTLAEKIKSEYVEAIYLDDVVESIIPLLEKQGYCRLEPIEAQFFGSSLEPGRPITKDFSTSIITQIMNYNKKVDRKWRESK